MKVCAMKETQPRKGLAVLALAVLAACATSSPAPARYAVAVAFTADTGAVCKLRFEITTNATAGASFSVLLDSINGNYPPQYHVQFRQDTDVTFVPPRPAPYWAFWQLYFTVPGTAVIVNPLDSARILAPPAC